MPRFCCRGRPENAQEKSLTISFSMMELMELIFGKYCIAPDGSTLVDVGQKVQPFQTSALNQYCKRLKPDALGIFAKGPLSDLDTTDDCYWVSSVSCQDYFPPFSKHPLLLQVYVNHPTVNQSWIASALSGSNVTEQKLNQICKRIIELRAAPDFKPFKV